MKIILVGHEGSKKILIASSWLINKYIPKKFEVYFLNFGNFTGKLFRGEYISLAKKQVGGVNNWSSYIANYLKLLDDEYIIFGLDDYLLSGGLHPQRYKILLENMGGDVICGRLSDSSFYKKKEIDGDIIRIGKDGYTCTTQYCIWDREALIQILMQTTTPWDFEIRGTEIINSVGLKTIATIDPALKYPDYSCLSSKWTGIKVNDNNPEDVKFLKEHGYI